MTTRDCDCPHPFPFCVHDLGYVGEALAYHSRLASSIIGWPTTDYDADAWAAHDARMAAARAERIDAGLAVTPVVVAMAKADKPRIPLGTRLGSPDCIPCQGGLA